MYKCSKDNQLVGQQCIIGPIQTGMGQIKGQVDLPKVLFNSLYGNRLVIHFLQNISNYNQSFSWGTWRLSNLYHQSLYVYVCSSSYQTFLQIFLVKKNVRQWVAGGENLSLMEQCNHFGTSERHSSGRRSGAL